MVTLERVRTAKLSDVIMEKLEAMIMEGSLKPGQRLLPEREMAERFSVSRPSIREAVQKLIAKGLLSSRQGGGTYVVERIGTSFSDPLLQLFSQHPEAQYDLLEFRHALEGVCAYYAALRGTEADRDNLRKCHEQLKLYHERRDFEKEVAADLAFHLAIAEASHNIVLLHSMRSLLELLKDNVFGNLSQMYSKTVHRQQLSLQHQRLLNAICEGEPEAARDCAHEHFAYVEEVLMEVSKEKTRLQRSLRRQQLLEQ
ncbi:pyruvate dehydrogenase complex transcriptional repressor PdhR [Pokkaliibacter sp. CJK22405]|uniref:pyruvate dehydrogenase complex transcriptional repressor PdhR n=1 Tax=Pokkaliibacter sp. CJK22405 TaxID=3384615 RepID=UPI003984D465